MLIIKMTNAHGSEWMKAALGLGVCVMLGLVLGGYLLGSEVRDFKRADRYVEVKGLVERTVKSDSATWTLSFKEPGDQLGPVFATSEKDKNGVLSFLAAQGFKPSDISIGAIDVTDRTTAQYGEMEKGPRFVVEQTVTVQSPDVDHVAAANSKTADLVKAGIVATGGVVYNFNGLNALKPDMITEATRNARDSANRFAADSGAKVGSIRSANQGVFSITAVDTGPDLNDDAPGGVGGVNPDQQADGSIMKKVRVVSTIDYYLSN